MTDIFIEQVTAHPFLNISVSQGADFVDVDRSPLCMQVLRFEAKVLFSIQDNGRGGGAVLLLV